MFSNGDTVNQLGATSDVNKVPTGKSVTVVVTEPPSSVPVEQSAEAGHPCATVVQSCIATTPKSSAVLRKMSRFLGG